MYILNFIKQMQKTQSNNKYVGEKNTQNNMCFFIVSYHLRHRFDALDN
jgi:hypothetical protein